jgi:hypothetical protein
MVLLVGIQWFVGWKIRSMIELVGRMGLRRLVELGEEGLELEDLGEDMVEGEQLVFGGLSGKELVFGRDFFHCF